MRRTTARPSQVQSKSFNFASVPDSVMALLDTRAENYGDACRLGREAADVLAECMRDDRYKIANGLLPKVAHYLATEDCTHGISVGFWGRVDELLVRASSPGIFTAFQQPAAAKGAHGPRTSA